MWPFRQDMWSAPRSRSWSLEGQTANLSGKAHSPRSTARHDPEAECGAPDGGEGGAEERIDPRIRPRGWRRPRGHGAGGGKASGGATMGSGTERVSAPSGDTLAEPPSLLPCGRGSTDIRPG